MLATMVQIWIIVLILLNSLLTCQVSATLYAYNLNVTDVFDDMEASFGPNIDANGISGLLVRADPIDACKPVKPSPFGPCNPQNMTIASFALIKRGGCDFGFKVWNAQAAGFCGAVVFNVNSDGLVRMSTSMSSDIYIPSVFIGESSATRLNSTYLYDDMGNPYIQLYEYAFNPLDYYLVPFIVVIAVCFVSLVCFLLVKCLRDRRRARRGRLSLQRLKKLPVKKFDKGDEYDVCAICLEDYEEGDSLRILPCDHAYHCKCVDPWLTSNKRICPLCKRKVLSDDESSASSEDVDSSDDEHTPLVRPTTVASPHSLRNNGYGSSGSFDSRLSSHRLRNSSTSSTDTTSTDIPEPGLLTPKNIRSEVSSTERVRSRVNQSFTFSEDPKQRSKNVASTMNTNVWMDPDDYLSTAEAVLTGPRVSESSITVLPDLAVHDEMQEHSYNSEDFHSFDESSVTVENSLTDHDEMQSTQTEHDTDQDDIIVIARGSMETMGENDSEV